jgi:hypothetical protein
MAVEAAAKEKENKNFQFYADADIDQATGKIKSEYPQWYSTRMLSEKEEELTMKKIALANGGVPQGYESEYREGISKLEKQIESMKDNTLIDDASNDRDEIKTIVDKIAKVLKDEYPTSKECDRRVVDINQENRKRFTPYLNLGKIGDDNIFPFARACDVSIDPNGLVTRDGLEKMWKIGRKYLGEYANVEILRRG